MNEHKVAHHGNVTITGCQMQSSSLVIVTIIHLHVIAAQHYVDLCMQSLLVVHVKTIAPGAVSAPPVKTC